MRYLIFLFAFFSFSIQAQKLDVKIINGVQYKITNDTLENGVITKQWIPLIELGAELQAEVNSIEANISSIDIQINSLKANKTALIAKRKEYIDLITKLNGFK